MLPSAIIYYSRTFDLFFKLTLSDYWFLQTCVHHHLIPLIFWHFDDWVELVSIFSVNLFHFSTIFDKIGFDFVEVKLVAKRALVHFASLTVVLLGVVREGGLGRHRHLTIFHELMFSNSCISRLLLFKPIYLPWFELWIYLVAYFLLYPITRA